MKPFCYLLLCFILSGCVTQKACLERFPIQETHDTVIIYTPAIIEVPVMGTDTVYRWSTIFDTVFASSGTAHASSYVKKDTVYLNVWQSDTLLKVRLDSAFRELQIKDTEIYTVRTECEKGKAERFMDKLIILLAIVFGGLLIINLIKLFK